MVSGLSAMALGQYASRNFRETPRACFLHLSWSLEVGKMTKRGRVLVLVLAEDERQQRFVYRYLRQRFDSHEIRSDVAPVGGGSAEQWVRQRYPEKVKQYRTRTAETLLVVLIDADRSELRDRDRQLQEALEQARLARRSNPERIAHLIPKRNIETWIRCLSGHEADEVTDYKNRHDIDID